MSASSQESNTDASSEQHSSLRRDLPVRMPLLFAAQGLDATDLEYIGCGIFNFVFSFKCTVPKSSDNVQKFIIRVQKFPVDLYMRRQMVNTAATLRFLTPNLPLVPRFLRMEITGDNVLECAWMMMSYLSGTSLNEVLKTTSPAQEIQVCKKVAKVLHDLQRITFTDTGPLEADPDDACLVKVGRFEDFDLTLPVLDESAQPLLSSWLSLLLSWRADAEGGVGIVFTHVTELQHILSQMIDLEYFVDYDRLDSTVLSHSDLHGGNVLLDQMQDEEWDVTGILDWENARAMPRVLAPCSLEWMWSDELYEDGDLAFLWTGDLDFVPRTNAAGISPKNRQLKQAIDAYMASTDSAYFDKVYGRGRWIRRVAKYAISGWHDNRDDTMTEWLIKEWAEHKLEGTQ